MKAQLGSSFVGPESSGKVELVKVQSSHITPAFPHLLPSPPALASLTCSPPHLPWLPSLTSPLPTCPGFPHSPAPLPTCPGFPHSPAPLPTCPGFPHSPAVLFSIFSHLPSALLSLPFLLSPKKFRALACSVVDMWWLFSVPLSLTRRLFQTCWRGWPRMDLGPALLSSRPSQPSHWLSFPRWCARSLVH